MSLVAIGSAVAAVASNPALAQDDSELSEVLPPGLGWEEWTRAGLVLVVAIVAATAVHRLVLRVVDRGDAAMVGRTVARFAAGAILGLGVVYSVNSLGVQIGPLLGVLGVGGIALAFALQDILENLISGLILQARRPFSIGDEVITNSYEGAVEDVNLRSVVIRTFDGRKVIVPSSMVLKNPIENDTDAPVRRTTVLVGVAYDADVEVARGTIEGATASVDGVLADPAPEAYVESLGSSSVDIAVRFWHDSARRSMWATRSAVIVAIKAALDESGIEIPFPHRVLQFSGVAVDAIDGNDA